MVQDGIEPATVPENQDALSSTSCMIPGRFILKHLTDITIRNPNLRKKFLLLHGRAL